MRRKAFGATRAVAVTCLLAVDFVGCGRVGYDDVGDGGMDSSVDAALDSAMDALSLRDAVGDTAVDAPGDAAVLDAERDGSLPSTGLDPRGHWCLSAEAGPFVEVGRYTEDFYFAGGLWYRAPHLVSTAAGGGLSTFTFDGTTFTQTDQAPGVGFATYLSGLDERIFLSSPATGVIEFALTMTGGLVEQNRDTTAAPNARRAWAEGNLLVVPSGGDGLVAFNISGGAMTPVGTPAPPATFSQAVHIDGNAIFVADATNLRALTFDGSTFSVTDATATADARGLWGRGRDVFVAHNNGVTAYRLIADTLTAIDFFATAAPVREVWSDGVHVFVAAETDGLYALTFEADSFNEIDRQVTGSALSIVGDGTYIYVGDGGDGIRAYSGFACNAFR